MTILNTNQKGLNFKHHSQIKFLKYFTMKIISQHIDLWGHIHTIFKLQQPLFWKCATR